MMNVSEYASDVGVTVKEILELCNKLDIKVSKEDDMLSDDDIIILDNELASKYNIGGLKNGISFLGTDFSKISERRYQGWFTGAGVAYGYAWILGTHWNLEAELGVGWIYTRFDSYPCARCGRKLAEDRPHHYVGPTKAAVNLVYTF